MHLLVYTKKSDERKKVGEPEIALVDGTNAVFEINMFLKPNRHS